MTEFVSKSPEETEKFGSEIASKLVSGNVVAFYGGLGSGKTTIIKSICRGLGVEETVTSPTYTIMHLYPAGIPVAHFDCYRLDSAEEAEHVGIGDYFSSGSICLIEWADIINSILPEETIKVKMSRIKGEETWRSISIEEK